jgi:thiamine-phosphate pyrophosphorylase
VAVDIRGLYVIVDPQQTRGRDPVEVARMALDGGAAIIQWRDKVRDKGEQIAQALAIRDLCRERHALFFVNDHVDLALSILADGAHLGQKDLPLPLLRAWLPPAFLLGVSSNTVEEATRAESEGADYVAVGAIFPTAGKDVTRAASVERLREVKAAVKVPVVAIGGIDEGNVDQVIAAGADAAAVISTVCLADDVEAAARRLASRFAPST